MPTTSGFKRGNAPFAESRGSASGRVWGSAPYRRSRQHRVSKGIMPLWQSPEAAPLAGFGAAPQGRPEVDVYFRRHARGESENSPVDCFWRGDALQERASPYKFPAYFFRGDLIISVTKKAGKISPCLYIYMDNQFLRERPLLQGVHSFPTVHRTVGKFTLCGAPEGCIDLRSIWGAAPNPARGAASGLCKRGIAPLETRY